MGNEKHGYLAFGKLCYKHNLTNCSKFNNLRTE